MNATELKCPKCGATLAIAKNEHIVKCRYCNSDICINNSANAVDAFIVDELQRDIANYRNNEEYDKQVKKWYKKRNIIFGIISLLVCIGFILINQREDLAWGFISAIISFITAFTAPLFMSAIYPVKPLGIKEVRSESPSKILLALKMYGLEACSLVMGSFIAYLIVDSIWGA